MKCKEYKKVAVVLGLLCVLAVAASWGQRVIRDGTIERKEAGEGSRIENISAYVDGQKYDMTVEVGERKLTEEEAQKLFKKAEKEIDKTFLGANESPEKITKPIVMKESYQEGMVEATWYLDCFDVVDVEGNLIREKISSAGTAVNAQVWLSYQEYQEVYRFSFMVYPPKLTTQEKIEEALQEAEKETENQTKLVLPTKLGKKEIQWKNQKSHEVLLILILAGIMLMVSKVAEKEKERREKKKREEELLLAYPQMISSLSVLLGAGMTVSKAWERLVNRYQTNKKKEEILYEEMTITWHEIQDGVGEKRAYENFGRRCNLPPYKKMVSIITQNLRKGSQSVRQLLEKEADITMQQRKNMAKKQGEEAGTKMLLPMMMMLGIVMVIVMVPAILSL